MRGRTAAPKLSTFESWSVNMSPYVTDGTLDGRGPWVTQAGCVTTEVPVRGRLEETCQRGQQEV